MFIPTALLPIFLRIPRKKLPNKSSRKERCSLSEALQLSLKFLINGLSRFPNGPLR
jgi:hypothetical protein